MAENNPSSPGAKLQIEVLTKSETSKPHQSASSVDLKDIAPFIPFLQTLAWVVVVVFFANRYKATLEKILLLLCARIEDGSSLNVAGVGIGAKPQSADEQKKHIEREISNMDEHAVEIEKSHEGANAAPSAAQKNATPESIKLRRNYYIAEDLAMRRIQEIYEVFIQRQASVGSKAIDGFFQKGDTTFGIDVKYVQADKRPMLFYSGMRLRALNIIDYLLAAYPHLNPSNLCILIVIVWDGKLELDPTPLNRLRSEINNKGCSIHIMDYNFDDLCQNYGIAGYE